MAIALGIGATALAATAPGMPTRIVVQDVDPASAIALAVSGLALVIALLAFRRARTLDEPAFQALAVRIIVVALALVTFGLMAPFLWRLAFGTPPPGAQDQANLLSVATTLISILVGTAGYLIYAAVKTQLDARAAEIQTAHEVATKAAEEVASASTHALDTAREAKTAADLSLAQVALLATIGEWGRYKGYLARVVPGTIDGEDKRHFDDHVANAIMYSEWAVRAAERLGDPKYDATLAVAKNALAYHLGSRGHPGDYSKAMALVAEIELDSATNWHFAETIAWVCLRFQDHDPDLANRGWQYYDQALATADDEGWKADVRALRGLSKAHNVTPDERCRR